MGKAPMPSDNYIVVFDNAQNWQDAELKELGRGVTYDNSGICRPLSIPVLFFKKQWPKEETK